MKSFKYLIFFLLIAGTTNAQNVSTIVENYKTALSNVEILHCQVEQLDTFVTGTVWNHIGQLTMMRDRADKVFGFYYRASKGVGDEALYDGLSDFQINHEKRTYEVTPNPQTYVLGSPGGQLVIPELMNYQDPETTPDLVEDDQYFVLRYTYPDLEEYDVRKREKKLFLDKTTFLPFKIIKRQESLGKVQATTRMISDLQVNEAEDQARFQKDFLGSYEQFVEKRDKNIHADLLKTQVKDFQLETFTGASISTQPKEAKLLLLDFWEVWCGPCVQSMPKVQELADKYRDQGLEVVGVLMDAKSQDSAEKLITKKDIAFTQALGNKELREYFRVYAIPQYVLVTQDGTIQHIYRGYDDKMEGKIKKLLAEAK